MKQEKINKLLEELHDSKDFILEDLPIVVQETFKYEKTSTLLNAFLMAVLMCAGLALAYCCWKNPKLTKYENWEISSVMGVVIPSFACPFLFLQLCYSVDKLIKIFLYPKYFLINIITSLKD